jgi:hypothetical protein
MAGSAPNTNAATIIANAILIWQAMGLTQAQIAFGRTKGTGVDLFLMN